MSLNESAEVTIAHSHSRNLPKHTAEADLFTSPLVSWNCCASWIDPAATMVDVGINRIPTAARKTRLVGGVTYQEVLQVAGAVFSTDVCVPIARLAECVEATKKDGDETGLVCVIIGHVATATFMPDLSR